MGTRVCAIRKINKLRGSNSTLILCACTCLIYLCMYMCLCGEKLLNMFVCAHVWVVCLCMLVCVNDTRTVVFELKSVCGCRYLCLVSV